MSLEAQLTELNENVKHQNALLQQLLEGGGGPVADGGDKQPAPAESEPEPEPKKEPAPEPGTTEDQGDGPSLQEVKDRLKQVAKVCGDPQKIGEILEQFGAYGDDGRPNANGLSADQYAAVIDAADEAIQEAGNG